MKRLKTFLKGQLLVLFVLYLEVLKHFGILIDINVRLKYVRLNLFFGCG